MFTGPWRTILVVAILLIAFFVRLAAIDHPLSYNGGDGIRDYVVAEHALTKGEWPIAGHPSGMTSLKNSPLYYYIVIFLTALGGSFYGVAVLHVLLNVIGILGVFFLAREFFGYWTGVIAMSLMAVASPLVFYAGSFVWSPYIMVPFVIFSLVAFLVGYRKRKWLFMVLSMLMAIMGVFIHPSAIALLPLYLVAFLLAAKDTFSSVWQYVALGFAAFAAFLLFFLPPFFAFPEGRHLLVGVPLHAGGPTIASESFFQNVINLARYGMDNVGLLPQGAPWYTTILLLLVLLAGLWFLVSRKNTKREKLTLIFLVFVFLWQVIFIALTNVGGELRHMLPVVWTVPIIIGAILSKMLFVPGRYALGAFFFLWIIGASLHATPSTLAALQNIFQFKEPHTELLDRAISAIEMEVRAIQKKDGYADFDFFSIDAFRPGNFGVISAVFFDPLEKRLSSEFIKVSDSAWTGIKTPEGDDYIFLACMRREWEPPYVEECLEWFHEKRPHHSTPDQIFESDLINIYLSEKKS